FFVGLLLGGVGVLFLSIAESMPILHDSFLLTGGVLIAVGVLMFAIGVVMWVKRGTAQRLQTGGVLGQAQILGMTPTDFLVNRARVVDLQLQVGTPVHAPFVVNRRETVPPTMMGRLGTGQPLPVRVDPTRPESFVIAWEQA